LLRSAIGFRAVHDPGGIPTQAHYTDAPSQLIPLPGTLLQSFALLRHSHIEQRVQKMHVSGEVAGEDTLLVSRISEAAKPLPHWPFKSEAGEPHPEVQRLRIVRIPI